MAYKKRRNPQYGNPRRAWMKAYRKAKRTRNQLLNDGWTVERGALTPIQVDRRLKELEADGFETQTIPFGQTSQFVAYKPKPAGAGFDTKRGKLKGTPINRFITLIEQPDSGFGDPKPFTDLGIVEAMRKRGEDKHNLCVIMQDAAPQKAAGKAYLKMASEILDDPDKNLYVNHEELEKLGEKGVGWVACDKTTPFSLETMKDALRILGMKDEDKVYAVYGGSNLVLFNPQMHKAMISPSMIDPDEWLSKAVTAEYVEEQVLGKSKSNPLGYL